MRAALFYAAGEERGGSFLCADERAVRCPRAALFYAAEWGERRAVRRCFDVWMGDLAERSFAGRWGGKFGKRKARGVGAREAEGGKLEAHIFMCKV